MLEQRIEWLATFCNLPPRAVEVMRSLAREDVFIPLGRLIDLLNAPAFEVAQLASRSSPLREWGLVRLTLAPEPSLKLNERIWRFLHDEAPAQVCDLPAWTH